MRFIFDLDHTAICANHRGAFDSNGNGCLETWIANSTPENIAKDSLLPLAAEWQKLLRKGAHIIVCTSRVMGAADFKFLRDNGLHYHTMLHRPATGYAGTTAQMKRDLLGSLGWAGLCKNAVMFDDDQSVIDHLSAQGLKVKDAKKVNDFLQS
jgi:hypothetical protein